MQGEPLRQQTAQAKEQGTSLLICCILSDYGRRGREIGLIHPELNRLRLMSAVVVDISISQRDTFAYQF